MRNAGYVAGGLLVAIVLSVVTVVVGVRVVHPRDEVAYLAYLKHDGGLRSSSKAPESASLIAEGDRACAWLSSQPSALWRTSERYGLSSVARRYQRETAHKKLEWGHAPPHRSAIRMGAWVYLCPATWVFHKPL